MALDPYRQGGLPEPFQSWLDRFVSLTTLGVWSLPTLLNSWSDYGSGYRGARFRISTVNEVQIQGMVASGTTTTGTAIFTLPTGYRPVETLRFNVVSNGVIGIVDVQSDGDVAIIAGSATYLNLTGIAFHAE